MNNQLYIKKVKKNRQTTILLLCPKNEKNDELFEHGNFGEIMFWNEALMRLKCGNKESLERGMKFLEAASDCFTVNIEEYTAENDETAYNYSYKNDLDRLNALRKEYGYE